MNTQAVSPLFTPNLLAGQPRPSIKRSGSESRYDEALEYLRLQLKTDRFELLTSTDLSNAFRITGRFMSLLQNLKAVERSNSKSGCEFKALPNLFTITGKQVVSKNRELAAATKNSNKFCSSTILGGPMPDCGVSGWGRFDASTPSIDEPTLTADIPDEIGRIHTIKSSETYLIGVVDGSKLSINVETKLHLCDPAEVMRAVDNYPCQNGQKIVLLQVVDVYEPMRILQHSTL